MSDYGAWAQDFRVDLVNQFGIQITYRQFVTTVNGPNPTRTHSDRIITARVRAYPLKMIDGTTIRNGDLNVVIPAAALTIAPQPGDLITLVGATAPLTVVTAIPRYAGDTIASYEIQGR